MLIGRQVYWFDRTNKTNKTNKPTETPKKNLASRLMVADATFVMEKWCRANREERWHDADAFFTGHIDFGTTIGLLTLEMKCPCGRMARAFMFFCISETDRVYNYLAPSLSPSGKQLTVSLPTGDTSKFSLLCANVHPPRHGDARILEVAVKCNENKDIVERTSLDLLFDTLRSRILLRSAFKKLYYRSFRLSFAPGGAAAKRNQVVLFETTSFCCEGPNPDEEPSFGARQIKS